MTMPFDQLLRRTEIWLACLDRERDLVMRHMHIEGRKPHLIAWLEQLDAERKKHVELTTNLQALWKANHPMLLLPVRPTRMVRATVTPRESFRKRA